MGRSSGKFLLDGFYRRLGKDFFNYLFDFFFKHCFLIVNQVIDSIERITLILIRREDFKQQWFYIV